MWWQEEGRTEEVKFYWCKDRMTWVEKPPVAPRSVHIIGDQCEHISPADGKGYSSKSAYRRSLKDHGMIEIGNDRIEPKPFRPTPTGDVLRRVAYQKGVRL